MTTNVPQDVLEDAKAAGLIDEHGSCVLHSKTKECIAKFAQLRAQRQQGAEPVAIVTVGANEHGPFSYRETPYGIDHLPDGETKLYTTPPQANALVAAFGRKAAEMEKFPESFVFLQEVVRHMTLWAEGKVWGSSRNAYDDTYPEKGDIRRVKRTAAFLLPGLKAAFNDLVEFYRGYEKRASLPSAIPADAEAALREVEAKAVKRILNLVYEQAHIFKDKTKWVAGYNQACADIAESINSVLGEGGK